MKFFLFFIVCIMFILTKRYNEYDFFENQWLDLLIQFYHVSTLIIIFLIIVSQNEPFIALFCAYVLHKNLNWFMGELKYENDEENENIEQNPKENKENDINTDNKNE